MVHYFAKSFNKAVNIFLVLFLVIGCTSALKKNEYGDLEDNTFLGEGSYEQLGFEEEDFNRKRTDDIDKFIDTPYRYQKLEKRRVSVELDQSHSTQIRKVIIKNIPKFKECYVKYYKKKRKGPRGVVPLNFTLKADGKVQRAGVGESKVPLKIKACLVEAVYKVQFPPSPNGDLVRVKQPLNF